MSIRTMLIAGALLLALGVAAGAFGAHGLRRIVSPDLLEVWKTAVLYQLIHGLGLLLLAALARSLDAGLATWAAGLMLGGVLVFSGSLYALTLSGVRVLGAITPVGGALMIAAWAVLAVAAWRAAPG
ncbi:DUF423 domain-containing protein [Castellaniella sp. GW247-6E4]|uniref:DUF423 domain-containing protein n=1 Tax=Castellaniella sp. GW247-6E4 TaxID=3140380 RepID=UPI0033154AE5